MTATPLTLKIKQGETFTRGLTWHLPGPIVDGVRTPGDPRDLTGWTARMQIRKKQGSEILLEATTENSRIILGDTTGRVTMSFDAATTGALTSKQAAYDLELISPTGEVVCLLEGDVLVTPNITQADGEPVLK